ATSITVPPVNSTDRCSPRWNRKNTASAKVTNEMMFSTSAWRMNGMVLWMRKNSMALVLDLYLPSATAVPSVLGRHTVPIDTDLSFFFWPYQKFTRPREKNTAENIEVTMPMQCTTAKPRTGPEPKAS